jgi:hypothetical protein
MYSVRRGRGSLDSNGISGYSQFPGSFTPRPYTHTAGPRPHTTFNHEAKPNCIGRYTAFIIRGARDVSFSELRRLHECGPTAHGVATLQNFTMKGTHTSGYYRRNATEILNTLDAQTDTLY